MHQVPKIFILSRNSTCFGHLLCPSSGVISCTCGNWYVPCRLCGRWGSRDSVVGIATRYGLEDPRIESRWGEFFRTYPDRHRGPPSLLYNGYRVFPGGKGGRGVMLTTHTHTHTHTPPSRAEVMKDLNYLSTHPMGPPGPVTGSPPLCGRCLGQSGSNLTLRGSGHITCMKHTRCQVHSW
jgi:hypothetical protein